MLAGALCGGAGSFERTNLDIRHKHETRVQTEAGTPTKRQIPYARNLAATATHEHKWNASTNDQTPGRSSSAR